MPNEDEQFGANGLRRTQASGPLNVCSSFFCLVHSHPTGNNNQTTTTTTTNMNTLRKFNPCSKSGRAQIAYVFEKAATARAEARHRKHKALHRKHKALQRKYKARATAMEARCQRRRDQLSGAGSSSSSSSTSTSTSGASSSSSSEE
jgi:uncharacterized membrane protein YgcG